MDLQLDCKSCQNDCRTDNYAKQLADKWKPTVMTAFSNLKKDEVDAIMKYVDDYTPPAKTRSSRRRRRNSTGIRQLIIIRNPHIGTRSCCLYIITGKQQPS
jgi:hypothetical protein